MNYSSRTLSQRSLAGIVALAAAGMLAACDQARDPPRGETSAGQAVDNASTAVQQKSSELAADTRDAGKQAMQTADSATTNITATAKDAAITTAVNAKLVADASLSALKIDVDTADGRVTLSGSAPDPAARTHASDLASQVNGVVAVDNRLVVGDKS